MIKKRGWLYQRLPTNASSPRKRPQEYALQAVGLLLFGGVIFFLSRTFMRPVYSPLDNYQILNTLPVTAEMNMPSSRSSGRAVATSLYSNNFAIATAVLGHSIRSANSTARLIMIYLEDRISEQALCINKAVGWETLPVPFIAPPHNGEGIHPRFKDQYTKLNIWSLDKLGIEQLVYLDADTLARRNFDELFELPFNFGAVPDVYGPDDPRGFSLTFNAGVMALRPSSTVLKQMKEKIQTANYPPKGAEQAFLNLYFGAKGARLPYVYNALISIKTRSPALWKELKEELRILHYTMVKPFLDDSHPPEKIPTPAEIEATLTRVRLEQSEYAEEIEWWRSAYKGMMEEKGIAIHACFT